MLFFRILSNNGLVILTSVVIKPSIVPIFGQIIPDPFIIPPIVIFVPDFVLNTTAIVFGTEATGISEIWQNSSTKNIIIPMSYSKENKGGKVYE